MLAFMDGKVKFETIVLHEIGQDIAQIRDAPATLGVQSVDQYADFALVSRASACHFLMSGLF